MALVARGFIPVGLRSRPLFKIKRGPLRAPTGRCDASLNPLTTKLTPYKGFCG